MNDIQTTINMIEKISKHIISDVKEDDYYEEEIEYMKVTKIDRNEDYLVTGVSWKTEYIKEKKLDTSKIILRIKNTNTYADLLQNLKNKYLFKKNESESIINAFLEYILKNGFSEQSVKRLIEDLQNIPPSWKNYVKLRGLVVKGKISIGKYLFRDITKKDLEIRVRRYLHHQNLFNYPHSILEFENKCVAGHENQSEIVHLINVLKLYTPSAIHYEGYRMQPLSFTHLFWGGEMFSNIWPQEKPIFTLTEKDSGPLLAFIKFMIPKIDTVTHKKENTPLNIAYQRYNDSLINKGALEEQLTSAIMGLEALFLIGNQELSYQLRIKIAKLLSYLDESPDEVINTIKISYMIRSKYIHGSILREKNIEKANKLLELCRNYLRKVLVYWMYYDIQTENQKSHFLTELENALINDEMSTRINEKASAVKRDLPGAIIKTNSLISGANL